MKVSIVIATYGEESWRDLAMSRAYPSALAPYNVVRLRTPAEVDRFVKGL